MCSPIRPRSLSELTTEPVGSICETHICYYPFSLWWIYYITDKHFILYSCSLLIVAPRSETHRRTGTPLRHNSACSPRVTPLDMGCWKTGYLSWDAQSPQGLHAILCAKTKCHHAGWGHVPALCLREFHAFLCHCATNRHDEAIEPNFSRFHTLDSDMGFVELCRSVQWAWRDTHGDSETYN